MRDIKFRAWNDIDESYIDWMTLCGMPKLITNIARGKERHYQLEQYTGLKDKNGVEIYEGDIVHNSNFTDDCNHMVDMIEDLGQWFMVDINEGYAEPLCDWLDSSVVIGNIHQNPELLEDKK